MKEPWARDIQRGLVDVLASNAIAYSTVTKHLRSANFEVKDDGSDERPGNPRTNLTNDQILHTLEIFLLHQVPDCSDEPLTENNGVSAP
jgi:hypothetical protein